MDDTCVPVPPLQDRVTAVSLAAAAAAAGRKGPSERLGQCLSKQGGSGGLQEGVMVQAQLLLEGQEVRQRGGWGGKVLELALEPYHMRAVETEQLLQEREAMIDGSDKVRQEHQPRN